MGCAATPKKSRPIRRGSNRSKTGLRSSNRLKRKYGGTIESALETLARSRAEIAELESMEENKGRAEAELAAALDALAALREKAQHAAS